MAFFSKLTETISDTSKVVAQKAKDVAEITKLNNQISNEEDRINAAYIAIGKRFFEENAGEVSEAYISNFSIINDSKAKIRQYQDQIKVIKGVSVCSNCGAEVPMGAAFCNACGSKVEQPKAEKDSTVEENEENEKNSEDSTTNTNDNTTDNVTETVEFNDSENEKTE